MTNNKDNTKIFINTIFLYFKLIISTFIGLYVSREVLRILGESDFGLYAVVGGIVALMNFLSTVMSSTSYRFIAIEIGKGENGDVNKIFNTVLVIHSFLAIIVLIFGNTVGMWYVNNHLNVAAEKIADAQYILHTSIFIAMANVLSVPCLGLIVAKEKFFYNSMLEIFCSLLKLAFIIFLTYAVGNKLRLYASIMLLVDIVKVSAVYIYCIIKDRPTLRWKINRCINDYKAIFSYSGWIMLGATACVGQTQGLAIIINKFFTTAVNAAFGVAQQVNSYIMMFVRSVSQAAVPQMMKNYSGGNTERTISLLNHITKYAFFIMLFPAIPCMICMQSVLDLWLVNPPAYTAEFAVFLLINGLVNCLGVGFDTVIQATGKIKKYQIGFSTIYLLTLPVSILLFALKLAPYSIIIANIGLAICQLAWQSHILTKLTDFKIGVYVRKTIVPVGKVTLCITPLFILSQWSTPSLLVIGGISIITSLYLIIAIYFCGFDLEEKSIVKKITSKILRKLWKRQQ